MKKVEFLLPFGFCAPKVGPVVCVNFVQGEVCVESLFVCFSSDGQANEVEILSADDWVCFCFVCCLGAVSCTVCYWWVGDAGSCIPVVSFV